MGQEQSCVDYVAWMIGHSGNTTDLILFLYSPIPWRGMAHSQVCGKIYLPEW